MTMRQSGWWRLIAAAAARASPAYGVKSEETPTSQAPEARAARPRYSKLRPKCR